MYYPPLCHLLPRLLATGRADAQKEELANLRSQNMTFTNDVRLNNVRLGADGAAAQSMGLLQFASTLHATQNAKKEGDEGAAAPFDVGAALSAMQAQPAASSKCGQGPALQLGYGGAEGVVAWEKERKKKKKEKKRKRKAERKAKKAERKAKMAKKRDNLVKEKGMSYEEASIMVEDLYPSSHSDSDSDSDSDS
jgi:hypothetical protein